MAKSRDTVRIPFHAFMATTFTTSAVVFLSPLITPRLTAIADSYDEYRFESFKFRIRDGQASNQAACFIPGIVDTPPATLSAVGEVLNSVMIGVGETIPSNWSNISKGVLSGMHPWYKTVAGTPESSEEIQGNVCIFEGSGAGVSVVLEISGVCAMRAGVNAGNTPLDRQLALRRREKQRIVSLLASPDPPATKSKAVKGNAGENHTG